jgi:uncharacterized protein (TIRG00374 family)
VAEETSLLSPAQLRLIAASALLAVAVYAGLTLWAGAAQVGFAFVRIGPTVTLATLALAFGNFVLRAVRWQLYMRRLGHRLPWGRTFRIYLAGLTLTVSPAKIGENLRAPLLKRVGVPYPHSFAAFVNDRAIDLGAVLLLSLIGLGTWPKLASIAIGVGLAIAFLAFFVVAEARLKSILNPATLRGRALAALRRLFQAVRECNSAPVLLAGLSLGLLAWSAEGLALHLILGRFGLHPPLLFSLSAFSIAILAGAASFVPGGIGGTEAVMALLIASRGLPAADAVAAAMAMRLATLWFAVLVGFAALQWELVANRRVPLPPDQSA